MMERTIPEGYTEHNLNDRCKVQLLPPGEALLTRKRDEMRRFAPDLDWDAQWRPGADGFLNMQLHEVINFFGGALFNGGAPPIKTFFYLRSCI